MKYNLLIIIIILTASFQSQVLYGQKAEKEALCDLSRVAYLKAEKFYIDGDLDGALDILEETEKKIKKSQCVDIHRDILMLSAKIYLLTNEDDKAKKAHKKGLLLDPSYEPKEEAEPSDFIYFSREQVAVPRWAITPKISLVNTRVVPFYYSSYVNSVEGIYLGDYYEDDRNLNIDYGGHTTFGGELQGSFFLRPNIELLAGIGYDYKSFELLKEYNRDYVENAQLTSSAFPLPSDELLYIEEVNYWMNVPLGIRYNIGRKNLIVSLFGGVDMNWLLDAKFREAYRGGFDLINELEKKEGEMSKDNSLNKREGAWNDLNGKYTIDIDFLRRARNISPYGGIGIKYRPPNFKKHYFTFDVKWAVNRKQINFDKPFIAREIDKEYNDLRNTLFFALGYGDDDISLNYTQFSLGYSFVFYQTKKNKIKTK